MGTTVLKLSFGEVSRRFYVAKIAPLACRHEAKPWDHKIDDKPPQVTTFSDWFYC